MNAEMPIVVLVGSPYERGLAHGSRFRKEISAILDRDLAALSVNKVCDARTRASAAYEEMLSHAPDVAEEIKGIAEGCGRPLNDLVLRSGPELFNLYGDTGCSALAFKTDTGAVAAQNWDGMPAKDVDLALFLHFSHKGFKFAVVTSFGGLCNVGMNSHGLALVNNDILLNESQDGITSQAVRRLVMDMPDVKSARSMLASLTHIGGKSHLFADRNGDVANVEISAVSGANFLPPADVYVHTNNALLPVTTGEENTRALSKHYPSSSARLRSLQAAIAREALSVDGAMRVLRDESGAPNSVCKTASADEPTQTAFSVVMDCARGEIHLAAGRPSLNAYRRIAVPTS
ncbi:MULTISPECIES: C45 family peptidase [unclassified Mesorhizobium]|uniref:C45 family autoproteolytic acyltransferase/hydolase n=1 Tax=unclassified Mesorhizobium TaxID=325217 RepID=UPI000FD52182|nr:MULTISPECIES: C45 family peptidase [unclassified Mesorhizobium]RUV96479.1 acyl-CoA-6-aminopenicillanic acid acyltransferase [Mesorhizobium sp. M5C.F.Ca.IN.020.14.1.1]RUV27667.1 acyl-CoA-6-aminopenicillanic acid acyltransferase [Mesorhizobium sp. M5C.F.Ca.IN.020.32.2.1]RWG50757.1 MAG: acyl-CoA-6-aminopenicillanic acid acyltransferase [Mesorhizobium sp.]RWH55729.1 MAG: acyl-CoA-6-aminopenicillanic acid acyltransferase [Mesorhizobium sp.]RWI67766.1 MAG: acyl-CoA-6-aminopenicillanic acid acyltr